MKTNHADQGWYWLDLPADASLKITQASLDPLPYLSPFDDVALSDDEEELAVQQVKREVQEEATAPEVPEPEAAAEPMEAQANVD